MLKKNTLLVSISLCLQRSSMIAFAGIFAALSFSFLLPASVQATGEQYSYYYPADPQVIKDLSSVFKDKERDADVLDNDTTLVMVKGGIFGDQQYALKYSADKSNSNASSSYPDIKIAGERPFIYSTQYYCGKDSKKISPNPPDEDRYLVTLNAMVDLGPNFYNNPHQFRLSIGQIDYRQLPKSSNEPAIDPVRYASTGAVALDESRIQASGIPRECLPSYNMNQDAQARMSNYQQLSKEDKEAWNLQQARQNGNANGDETDENSRQADCDLTGSPVSWIVCPIIDMGANLTDFVFKDIVSPLLKEVPISSNPDDPGFIAWQQFRLLGNILLVGTLLAVVYSQMKGDK